MQRIAIQLTVTDKRWLVKRASKDDVSMTEVVRRAIRSYRSGTQRRLALAKLAKLQGSWKHGDGLAYQQTVRAE